MQGGWHGWLRSRFDHNKFGVFQKTGAKIAAFHSSYGIEYYLFAFIRVDMQCSTISSEVCASAQCYWLLEIPKWSMITL